MVTGVRDLRNGKSERSVNDGRGSEGREGGVWRRGGCGG